MSTVLIILLIYIVMVIVSLLGPYIDYRKECIEERKIGTLEDFYDDISEVFITSLIPVINVIIFSKSLLCLIGSPIWNRIKHIRIV